MGRFVRIFRDRQAVAGPIARNRRADDPRPLRPPAASPPDGWVPRAGGSLEAAILETALDAIVAIDGQGRVAEWNPAAVRIFGHAREEAVGRPVAELIIPEADREAHRRGLARQMATGESTVLGRRVEVTALRKGGEKFPAELSVLSAGPAGGGPPLFVAHIRDITERRRVEAALAEAARRSDEFMGTVPGLYYMLDPEGRLVRWNGRLVAATGLNAEELCGRPALELFAPEDRPAITAAMGETLAGRSVHLEGRLIARAGTEATFLWNGAAMRDDRGRVTGTINFGLDVTESKAAEEARRRDEDLLRTITDNSKAVVYLKDSGGRYKLINQQWAALFGVTQGSVVGRTDHDIFPAEVADAFRTNDLRVLMAGHAVELEEVAPHADGPHTYLSIKVPLIGPDGRPYALCGISTDITERKRMEEALRLSEEQFRGAFEAAAVGMAVASPEGRWLRVNHALREIVGYTEAELLATTALAITHPDDLGASLELMRRTLAGEIGSYQLEKRYLQKGGEVVWVRLSISLVRDAGGWPLHFVGQFEDITPRKRAEERTRALHAELQEAYDATIEGWARALDLRDHETEGHSRRVTAMTLRLARTLGTPEADLVHVRRGTLLHDIGKMGIPDAVLRKPGPLDEAEWAVMRQHPRLALEMLAPVAFLGPSLDIPYCHHEKWDGSGYPRGLSGERIPLAARMFAAVDVCDALLSDRPYRKGWPVEAVREHIRSLSGSHLDPRVVEAFLPMIGEPDPPVPAGIVSHAGVREAGADETDTEHLGAAFRALLEHSDDFVVLLDGAWQIRAASRSFLTAFAPGLPPRGLDFVGLLDTGSRDKFRTLLRRPLDGSFTLEVNHRTPSKALRLVTYAVCELSRPPGACLLTAVGRGQEASLELVEKLVFLNQELEVSRRDLAEQALSDPLTGLGNRRWLFEQLEALWAEGRRQGRRPWVMMADLDHFKAVNDTYGHRAGDEVLLAASGAMRQSVRTGDVVARYGGEEFVLAGLCDRGSDPPGLADRVLEAIRALRVECPGGPLRVTGSIGLALAEPDPSNPPWVVLQSADRALYRAKAGGRDRFEAEPGLLGRRTAPPGGDEVMGGIGI